MEVKKAIIPAGHPNRLGWKLEAENGYIIHSTANIWPGSGDEWHAGYFARPYEKGEYLEGEKIYEFLSLANYQTVNVLEIKTRKVLEVKSTDGGLTIYVMGKNGQEKYFNGRKVVAGVLEKGSIKDGYGQKFRVASTHAIADHNSITEVLPLNEFAAGAGDRNMPWTENLKGQTHFAKVFNNRQNYRFLQIEVSENSDGNWSASLNNACEWIIMNAKSRKQIIDVNGSKHPEAVLTPPARGVALVEMHGVFTGKPCPSRLMANIGEWYSVVDYIAKYVNG